MNWKKWCEGQSYYAELKRKSIVAIFTDQLLQTIRYGSPNKYYFSYGFDVKGSDEINRYLHYTPFMRMRNGRNEKMHNATALLRDKQLFGMFTDYYGIKSATNIAVSTKEGVFDLIHKKFIPAEELITNISSDIFVKPLTGECGKGIVKLVCKNGRCYSDGKDITVSVIDMLKSERYLVQVSVTQHERMKLLHPQSLNTIRMITIRNPKTGEPELFPSILRIGTGYSIVDNTSQGGIAVGINPDTGQLFRDGFYKPEWGGKVDIHPDSGIIFSDFVIPFFEECKQQALFLHSRLPEVHSVGWDIAIAPDGPVFIEGNDNWEINGPQICHGGLKIQLEKYF